MSKPRVLILGATGFIGRRIVAAFVADGRAQVVAAVHRRPIEAANVETIRLDATDRSALAAAIDSVDVVVNAVLGTSETIVSGMQTLLDAASVRRPRLVHLSTMSVYGSSVGRVTPDSPMRDDIGPYSQAKVAAERLIGGYDNRVVLRPGIVYGPGGEQWSGRIASLLRQHRLGDLGVAGDGICNLVHVDDVATACQLAAFSSEAAGRCYNLSLPQPPTWNEYFVDFAIALGATPVDRIWRPRIKLEKALGLPLTVAQRLASKVGFRLPYGVTPSLWRLWEHRIQLDVSATEAELGMQWIPLERGLAQSAASF